MSLSTNAHFERGIHPVQGFHVSRVPAPWRQAGRIAHLRSRRIFAVSIALGVTLAAGVAGPAMATGNGPLAQPQQLSTADLNTGGANGQCPGGPYCSTRDGSPSLNGNGNGMANGKPCAGCVGKADNKNPQGQMPNGSDHNAGYECDRNHGIGPGNPAHTGCTAPLGGGTPGGGNGGGGGGGGNPPLVVVPPLVVDPPVAVVTDASGGVQIETAKPVVVAPAAPVVIETSDGVQIAATHPLPSAARAGDADTSGQLVAGGLAGIGALLAMGAGFVLRRREGEV